MAAHVPPSRIFALATKLGAGEAAAEAERLVEAWVNAATGREILAFADAARSSFTQSVWPWAARVALDEHIEFFDGMPIFTVLPVVAAIVDDLMPASRLRPWSVAEVIHTMLPTNSGMAVASALDGASRLGRQLVSADRLDRDWLDLGLTGIPGHPALLGRATMFTYLDDARAALAGVADEVFTVRAGG